MLKSEALQILCQKISQCTKCKELAELRETNNWKTVPGIGNPEAKIMILGEAPGENEALQGEPFVGRAGQLLTAILKSIGLERQDIYITNILKCRPPGNRDPEKTEAENCRRFLDMQIRCIQPEWILCFGRIASVYLLGQDPATTIGSMRGKIHNYGNVKVICTYHPSYALRGGNPVKQQIWQDLQILIQNSVLP